MKFKLLDQGLPLPAATKLAPLLGWLYIAYGVISPFSNPWLFGLWVIILFISVVIHGMQVFLSIPIGKKANHSTFYAVIMTFLFGATWWLPLQFKLENSD